MANSERVAPGLVTRARGISQGRLLVALMVVAAIGAIVGSLFGAGSFRPAMMILGAAIGGALVALGFVRFRWFVVAILAVRTFVDVIGGGPRLLQPTVLVAAAFLLLGSLWLAAQEEQPERSTAEGCLFLLTLATVLAVPMADSPGTAFDETLRLASGVVMFAVVRRLGRDERVRLQILRAIFISTFAPIGFGLAQLATGSGTRDIGGFSRVTGTFQHPNSLATYLVIVVVAGVALRVCIEASRERRVLDVILVLSGVLLVATYSRAALIAVVVGLFVVGLVQDRRVIFAIAAVAVAVVIAVPSVLMRFGDIGSGETLTGQPSNSLSWRVGYWSEAVQLSESNRALGIGLGGVAQLLEEGKPPHNDFVRAFVEIGILGFAAYVAVGFSLVFLAWSALRATRRERGIDRGIAVAWAGCVTVFIVVSFTSNMISQVVVMWYLFTLAGLAACVARSPTGEARP